MRWNGQRSQVRLSEESRLTLWRLKASHLSLQACACLCACAHACLRECASLSRHSWDGSTSQRAQTLFWLLQLGPLSVLNTHTETNVHCGSKPGQALWEGGWGTQRAPALLWRVKWISVYLNYITFLNLCHGTRTWKLCWSNTYYGLWQTNTKLRTFCWLKLLGWRLNLATKIKIHFLTFRAVLLHSCTIQL